MIRIFCLILTILIAKNLLGKENLYSFINLPNSKIKIDTCIGECIRAKNVKCEFKQLSNFESNDAQIKLKVEDIKSYTITWSTKDDKILKEYNNFHELKNLKSGTYCYKIESERKCYVSNCVLICPFVEIKFKDTKTIPTSCNIANGRILINNIKVKGIEYPISYYYLKELKNFNTTYADMKNEKLVFENIFDGIYYLNIRDTRGCNYSSKDSINLESIFDIKIEEKRKKDLRIKIITNIKNDLFSIYVNGEEDSETYQLTNRKIVLKNLFGSECCFAVFGNNSNCRIDTCYKFNLK